MGVALVNFNSRKTRLVSFGLSNNFGSTDVKRMGVTLRKTFFKMLGFSSTANLDYDIV